ncbi:MAG: hypothetical protein AAGC93_12080 [Cyanobacteria bacterium P01_F01_bin.53]
MSHWESAIRSVVVSSSRLSAKIAIPVLPILAIPAFTLPAFSQASLEEGRVSQETTKPQIEEEIEEISGKEKNIPDFYPSGAIAPGSDLMAPDIVELAREAALLELISVLSADAQTGNTQTGNTQTNSSQRKTPGAEALTGLTSASLEAELSTVLPMEAGADLTDIASSFRVDPSSVPALKTALNSNNPLTQLYAADTLWTLTGDVDLILPTLMSVAASGETQPRELAMLALAQLGEEGAPAGPVLDEIINNSDAGGDSRTLRIAQDTLELVNSENRPATVLGILAREAGRLGGLPTVLRAISGLWR